MDRNYLTKLVLCFCLFFTNRSAEAAEIDGEIDFSIVPE